MYISTVTIGSISNVSVGLLHIYPQKSSPCGENEMCVVTTGLNYVCECELIFLLILRFDLVYITWTLLVYIYYIYIFVCIYVYIYIYIYIYDVLSQMCVRNQCVLTDVNLATEEMIMGV